MTVKTEIVESEIVSRPDDAWSEPQVLESLRLLRAKLEADGATGCAGYALALVGVSSARPGHGKPICDVVIPPDGDARLAIVDALDYATGESLEQVRQSLLGAYE